MQQALDDLRPAIAHDVVAERFAKRHARRCAGAPMASRSAIAFEESSRSSDVHAWCMPVLASPEGGGNLPRTLGGPVDPVHGPFRRGSFPGQAQHQGLHQQFVRTRRLDASASPDDAVDVTSSKIGSRTDCAATSWAVLPMRRFADRFLPGRYMHRQLRSCQLLVPDVMTYPVRERGEALVGVHALSFAVSRSGITSPIAMRGASARTICTAGSRSLSFEQITSCSHCECMASR